MNSYEIDFGKQVTGSIKVLCTNMLLTSPESDMSSTKPSSFSNLQGLKSGLKLLLNARLAR